MPLVGECAIGSVRAGAGRGLPWTGHDQRRRVQVTGSRARTCSPARRASAIELVKARERPVETSSLTCKWSIGASANELSARRASAPPPVRSRGHSGRAGPGGPGVSTLPARGRRRCRGRRAESTPPDRRSTDGNPRSLPIGSSMGPGRKRAHSSGLFARRTASSRSPLAACDGARAFPRPAIVAASRTRSGILCAYGPRAC